MTPEERRLINQQNAQKSTGPKTAAGKARSRRNALKHGLTGDGVVLHRPDQEKLARKINEWRETLAPINPIEETLVERAAIASVKLERATRREETARHRRMRRSMRRFDLRQERHVHAGIQALSTDPAQATQSLLDRSAGVSWVLSQWQQLADRLETTGHWTQEDAALALRLLGKHPECTCP